MKFGAILLKAGKIIGRGNNRLSTKEERARMRYVDYAIHAEQAAILDAIDNGYNPQGGTIYILGEVGKGVYKGKLSTRDNPVFGCKKCPNAPIDYNVSINIPTLQGWKRLSPEQAKETAKGIQGIWTNLVKIGEVKNR